MSEWSDACNVTDYLLYALENQRWIAQWHFHQKGLWEDAVEKSKIQGLDVVCFKDQTEKELAFCKMIDYGKWKYSEDKKKKKQNKEHKKTTKEIRISLGISDHDLEHKVKQAKDFLCRYSRKVLVQKKWENYRTKSARRYFETFKKAPAQVYGI